MAYRTCFVYPAADARAQRSVEMWLCYFLRPLLPKDVAWDFRELPGVLCVDLAWADEEQFDQWYHGDPCQSFKQAHGENRPLPRLRVPRAREAGRTVS